MKQFNGPARQRGFIGQLLGAVGGSLISGFFGKKAASKQARGEQRAGQMILDAAKPFAQAGQSALDPLVAGVTNPQHMQDLIDLTTRQLGKLGAAHVQPGLQGINSGGFATELGKSLAGVQQQQLDNLFRLATLGGNAAIGSATNAANMFAGAAGSRAAGTRALGTAAGEGFNSFLDTELGKRIFGP